MAPGDTQHWMMRASPKNYYWLELMTWKTIPQMLHKHSQWHSPWPKANSRPRAACLHSNILLQQPQPYELSLLHAHHCSPFFTMVHGKPLFTYPIGKQATKSGELETQSVGDDQHNQGCNVPNSGFPSRTLGTVWMAATRSPRKILLCAHHSSYENHKITTETTNSWR